MAYPYYNNYPQYNQQPQPQYQSQQMQTAGCMMVPSEEDVQKYPVAPNTAMVFLLQDLSACYIKATGSSMLDAPRIQRYIRDDHTNAPVNAQNTLVQKDTRPVTQGCDRVDNGGTVPGEPGGSDAPESSGGPEDSGSSEQSCSVLQQNAIGYPAEHSQRS